MKNDLPKNPKRRQITTIHKVRVGLVGFRELKREIDQRFKLVCRPVVSDTKTLLTLIDFVQLREKFLFLKKVLLPNIPNYTLWL